MCIYSFVIGVHVHDVRSMPQTISRYRCRCRMVNVRTMPADFIYLKSIFGIQNDKSQQKSEKKTEGESE